MNRRKQNKMPILKIKKLNENARIPSRATEGSAGMDLYSAESESITINPHECKKIHTGIAVQLESPDYAAFVYARSGTAIKHGVAPANCVGLIDSDYRGEIICGLVNQFDVPYTVEPGERIAQLVIAPVIIPEIEIADELDETDRGAGGFGSTGKK